MNSDGPGGTESAGDTIRRYRASAELSQEDVALALRVTGGAVSQWETGRAHPSRTNAIKLDRLLNAEGSIILALGYSEDPPVNGINGTNAADLGLHFNHDSVLLIEELSKLGAELTAMREEFGPTGQLVAEAAVTLDRLREQVTAAREALDQLAARVSALEGEGRAPGL